MSLFIRLEARNPALNVARFYEVEVTSDLFGLVVITRNGRIGSARGRQRVIAAGDEGKVQRAVLAALRRRQSAPKRIGAPYQLVAHQGDSMRYIEAAGA